MMSFFLCMCLLRSSGKNGDLSTWALRACAQKMGRRPAGELDGGCNASLLRGQSSNGHLGYSTFVPTTATSRPVGVSTCTANHFVNGQQELLASVAVNHVQVIAQNMLSIPRPVTGIVLAWHLGGGVAPRSSNCPDLQVGYPCTSPGPRSAAATASHRTEDAANK